MTWQKAAAGVRNLHPRSHDCSLRCGMAAPGPGPSSLAPSAPKVAGHTKNRGALFCSLKYWGGESEHAEPDLV